MLSLQNCRKLLKGEREELEDTELTLVRDQFYELARLTVEQFANQRAAYNSVLESFEPTEKEVIEERAAVLEFEGNIERETAEKLAITQAIEEWEN